MKNLINAFVKDEEAAVTVDWVVLTAAVVGLAIAVAATMQTALDDAASTISSNLQVVVGAASTTT